MKLQNTFFYFLIFIIFSITACQEEKVIEPKIEKTLLQLNASTLEWIAPFNTLDSVFQYKNSENVEATIVVDRRTSHVPLEYDSCFDDNGEYIPCERESTNLLLISNAFNAMNLSIWITGENRLAAGFDTNIGHSGGGTIFNFNEVTEDLQNNLYPDNFEVSFNSTYNFKGEIKNAVIVTNITLNDIYYNGNPAKGFILVKGIGIVEWTDRADAVWTLVD